MYTCGLTVYARGHIGNFRTFVCVDVLRRTLKYLAGYAVRQVMNFTDVDDRTIVGAQKAGMPLREYTDQFIAAFREDARGARPRAGRGERRARPTRRTCAAMADMITALEQQRPHLPQRRLDLLQDLDASRTTASWRISITKA